jgi:putative oxidoreductase
MENGMRLDVIGRLLLAAFFALGAVQKITAPAVVQGLLAGVGLPPWLIWPALAFNAAAAIALALGWRLRETALAAAAYCIVTSLFHFIPGDGWQMSIFVKNWAIAGGLFALAGARPA